MAELLTGSRQTMRTMPCRVGLTTESGYISFTRTGRFEICKVPVQGGSAMQLTKNGGNRSIESPDGKYVYHDKGPGAVRPDREFDAWRTPVDGGEEVPVFQNGRSRWSALSNGLYFFESERLAETTGDWFLKFFDFATKQTRVIAKLPGISVIGQRPAVSPDGRTVLYTQIDVNDTDLMLVDNFR
jgi:hypothetical protein